MSWIKESRYFIYSATLLSQPLFWGMCSLLGTEYDPESSGSFFVMYLVGLFGLTVLFSLKDIKFSRLSKWQWYLVGLVFFYFFCYIFDYYLNGGDKYLWTQKTFIFFGLFGISGLIIGTVASQNDMSGFYKHLDFLTFIIGVGFIRSLPKMMYAGGIIKGYQDISYLCALSFGFILYSFLSNREDRYFLFRLKIFKPVSLLVAILMIICVLASGGRGGAVLLIIEMLVCSLLFVSRKNIIRTVFLYIPLVFLGIYLVAEGVNNSALKGVLDVGIDRAFSYLSFGGIDMSETSNRDLTYGEAWQRIIQNPLVGTGVFKTVGKFGYPHNFFIEILESGGALLLLWWLFMIKRCFSNFKHLLSTNIGDTYLIPLILYPSTFLLFSGSYLMCCTFWFSLSVLFPMKPFHRLCNSVKLKGNNKFKE